MMRDAWMEVLPATDHYTTSRGSGCGGKRHGGRTPEQERKKGVPWTEDEHKLFLLGLKKYGKGDWRNISRNFVQTRTPTQVASHAHKYFIRLSSRGGKDKRRSSIHDITTVHLTDDQTPSPPQPSSLINQSSAPTPSSAATGQFCDSKQHVGANAPFSSPTRSSPGSALVSSLCYKLGGLDLGGPFGSG